VQGKTIINGITLNHNFHDFVVCPEVESSWSHNATAHYKGKDMYREMFCHPTDTGFCSDIGPRVTAICFPKSGPIVLKGRYSEVRKRMKDFGIFHYNMVFHKNGINHNTWDINAHGVNEKRYLRLAYSQKSTSKGDNSPRRFKYGIWPFRYNKYLDSDRPKWYLILTEFEGPTLKEEKVTILGKWRKLPKTYLRQLSDID